MIIVIANARPPRAVLEERILVDDLVIVGSLRPLDELPQVLLRAADIHAAAAPVARIHSMIARDHALLLQPELVGLLHRCPHRPCHASLYAAELRRRECDEQTIS